MSRLDRTKCEGSTEVIGSRIAAVWLCGNSSVDCYMHFGGLWRTAVNVMLSVVGDNASTVPLRVARLSLSNSLVTDAVTNWNGWFRFIRSFLSVQPPFCWGRQKGALTFSRVKMITTENFHICLFGRRTRYPSNPSTGKYLLSTITLLPFGG